MPDWFYRTVGQPCLFRLPDSLARRVALGTIGGLGKSRVGCGMIDFLGHMKADSNLAFEKCGYRFTSPMGIGWRVDPEGRATNGLARFGVGCIEILDHRNVTCRRTKNGELKDERHDYPKAETVVKTDQLVLKRRWRSGGKEFVVLPRGEELEVYSVTEDIGLAVEDLAGVVLQLGVRLSDGLWKVPSQVGELDLDSIRQIKERLPESALLVVSGGVSDPRDALAIREAGADVVLVDAGLVFSGPGLVKRCNDALLSRSSAEVENVSVESIFRHAWLWALGLGIALILGGFAATILAGTRVLLPYDEHFLGFTWQTLRDGTPKLFGFMSHDRGTLAGTMLGLGWLYAAIALGGIRCGEHGAKTAIVSSALSGFASFFAFFGFGYFDTLHAFVAAVLFQISVQVMVGREGGSASRNCNLDIEDATWRKAQWGHLFWIVHSAGLIVAGAVILTIGMSLVFVSEDLAFLCMTRDQVSEFGDRLMGVVAHDRATLGGMLLASGVASLLSQLWLFRRGTRWLWIAMLGFGAPAYAAAIGVHFWVGYVDWRHLAPAFAGLALWSLGLLLTHRYLKERRSHATEC